MVYDGGAPGQPGTGVRESLLRGTCGVWTRRLPYLHWRYVTDRTGIPAARARRTMSAVPRPPGKTRLSHGNPRLQAWGGGQMQLRYNFRIYPTPGQRMALARAFGCARVVYNDGLRIRQEAFKAGLPYIKDTDLQKQVITEAKKTPERAWLSEVSYDMLVQSLRDLHTAYRAFFSSIAGKRKGPKVAPPKFKSLKDTRQSIRFPRKGFVIRPNGRLYLSKIGDVRVRWSRELPSTPSSVTVIKDSAGRYFASFVVEVDDKPLPEPTREVGIDLGLTHFAVLSNGKKIASPKFLRRAERRLRKAQKDLSRKQKGSNNRKKAAARVAKLHARVADARRDHHHKLSTAIIRENQAVFVEDLNVKGLGRTRLAKSVYDAGWSHGRSQALARPVVDV